MSRWLVLLALSMSVTFAPACAARQIDPRAEHAEAGALGFWYGADTASLDRHEWPVKKLLDHRCTLSKMDPERAAFFVKAADYADHVIRSEAFGSLLASRTKWELTSDSGAAILRRLRSSGADINVFVYARDDTHPCGDNLAREDMNAFTPMRRDHDGHMLFLHERYLDDAMISDDVPALARTLVHESLHSLGYTHDGLEPDSARYNHTAPVYVGCVLEHWGGATDLAWIAANCDKATKNQVPPAPRGREARALFRR